MGRLQGRGIVVHGGAGAYLQSTTAAQRLRRGDALEAAVQVGLGKSDARTAVLAAVAHMEADERFNAGHGAKLQRDGMCRLSAALMDGQQSRMSSVYNVKDCAHPSALTDMLQAQGDRHLDGEGAAALMRVLDMASVDVRTERTLARWKELSSMGENVDPEGAIGNADDQDLRKTLEAGVNVPMDFRGDVPDDPENRYGTVGAVGICTDGSLWACTSTGGRGHETPGRISDSPTPAGTYACPQVALSATGFGEQILDLNVCGRIATRMIDGADLRAALERTFEEVVAFGGLLGVIAVGSDGVVGYAYTTEAMGVAWSDLAGNWHRDRHGSTLPRVD